MNGQRTRMLAGCERIIRNEWELDAVCHYICDNPTQWAEGPENPNPFKGDAFLG